MKATIVALLTLSALSYPAAAQPLHPPLSFQPGISRDSAMRFIDASPELWGPNSLRITGAPTTAWGVPCQPVIVLRRSADTAAALECVLGSGRQVLGLTGTRRIADSITQALGVSPATNGADPWIWRLADGRVVELDLKNYVTTLTITRPRVAVAPAVPEGGLSFKGLSTGHTRQQVNDLVEATPWAYATFTGRGYITTNEIDTSNSSGITLSAYQSDEIWRFTTPKDSFAVIGCEESEVYKSCEFFQTVHAAYYGDTVYSLTIASEASTWEYPHVVNNFAAMTTKAIEAKYGPAVWKRKESVTNLHLAAMEEHDKIPLARWEWPKRTKKVEPERSIEMYIYRLGTRAVDDEYDYFVGVELLDHRLEAAEEARTRRANEEYQRKLNNKKTKTDF